MIDTDKYEGYWKKDAWCWSKKMLKTGNYEEQMATASLLDDAPLLLAEVLRLREGLQEIIDDFETQKTDLWTMRNRIETILKGEE
jgi:hypothetical protein